MEKEMEYSVEQELRDVFIISDNIISSLGFSTEENITAMLAGKTGICLQHNSAIYPEPFMAAPIDKKRVDLLRNEKQLEQYSLLESLAILSISEAISRTSIHLSGKENLLILSTTKGNIEYLSGNYPPEKASYLSAMAGNIAGYFQMENTPLVVSNACVSGVAAVEIGARLLRRNLYKNIVVVGTDSISAFTVSGFQSFKSISSQPCKPYDKDRDGLSIGEGTASLILTNNEEYQTDPRAIQVLGGATANDANHISGPSRTGDGLQSAIEQALASANVDKQSIDFMNLHGTATVFNDEMESKAVALSKLSHVPANSFKGYWGHTLGASGVMEIIACAESIRRNVLIATLGFSEAGLPEPMVIIKENRQQPLKICLKTASGFGGVNSAIVLAENKCGFKKYNKNKPTEKDIAASCHCIIRNKQVIVDEQVVLDGSDAVDAQSFLKLAFKNLEISYPKFYKMDNLSKLGFLAVQYLLQKNHLPDNYDKQKIAIFFTCPTSSLDTDIQHQQSIRDAAHYFPSPSIFVYTLPNIMLGEICIKEKIQGETTCFVPAHPDEDFIRNYLRILLEDTATEAVIYGQVELLGEAYHASVFFVEKADIPIKCINFVDNNQ